MSSPSEMISSNFLSIGTIGFVAAAWLVSKVIVRGRKPVLPYPPGPPPKFIVGNALDIPKSTMLQAQKYASWKDTYGLLIHLNVMGTHLIVVNDLKIAKDLLEKRSAKYSDRAYMAMAGDLCGWDRTLILTRYGEDRFRKTRASFFKLFGTHQNMEEHFPIINEEAHKLMRRVVAHPDKLIENIRNSFCAISTRISYGYCPAEDGEDSVIHAMETALRQLDVVFTQLWLVDILPWLKKLPAWFPGAAFQRVGRVYREGCDAFCETPYRTITEKISKGAVENCFIRRQMDEGDYTTEKEFISKWTAAGMYGASVDTSSSLVASFFLAMTLFPDVFVKAQTEMDAVVGRSRTPTPADRVNLPYLNALHLEVLRYAPVLALNVPHRLTEDDMYNGYLLPEGSLVFVNTWHVLNDPEVYKNPREFNPGRFIGTDERSAEPSPREAAFGYGRRICPGMNLADATTWLQCAFAVALLSISRARDARGNEIIPEEKYDAGLTMQPKPFPCAIKPRDARAEQLLQSTMN